MQEIALPDSYHQLCHPVLVDEIVGSSDPEIIFELEDSLHHHFVNCLESVGNTLHDTFIAPIKRLINLLIEDKKYNFVQQLNLVDNEPLSAKTDSVAPAGHDVTTQANQIVSSISTPLVTTLIPTEPTLDNTFLSRKDLRSIFEKMTAQISLEDVRLAGQIQAINIKLQSADAPLTIKEWADILIRMDVFTHQYLKNYDQKLKDKNGIIDLGQQSVRDIILAMNFMIRFTWTSLAHQKDVTRLKQIYSEMVTPAFYRIHSGYVSGGIGVGFDLFGLFALDFLSGKVKLGSASIEINDYENFLGYHRLASVDTSVKAGMTVGIAGELVSADLSAEYIHSAAIGEYSECSSIENHVRGWFETLVQEYHSDPLIEPYLSSTKSAGCNQDVVMERLTNMEVLQIHDLLEQYRLTFHAVKQRLNIFLGKEAIQEINIPTVTPFKAPEKKDADILKFNAKVSINNTPLGLDGTVTFKRETLQQRALTYTNYCKFLDDPFRPEAVKTKLKHVIQQQCKKFESTLIGAWRSKTAQVRLNQQGIDVLAVADDGAVSDVQFMSYLHQKNLNRNLIRLRTDCSLQQSKQRWDFIVAHALGSKVLPEINDVETQFAYFKEDLKLYTDTQQQIARLQDEINRLRDTLSSEQAVPLCASMTQLIDRHNGFCAEIMQRYGAKDVEQFLHNVVVFNANLFSRASSPELKRAIRELEEKTLLNPKFKVDVVNWKENAQVEDESMYKTIDYEVNFNVQAALLDGNVTLRFRDYQHKSPWRNLDYLELTCGAGISVGPQLFETIACVFKRVDLSAMKQTDSSIFEEMGQIFDKEALGIDWIPFIPDVGMGRHRQYRFYKTHEEPIWKFKHILTRHTERLEIKCDLDLPIPALVPGLTVKVGGGYAHTVIDMMHEEYTGISLNPWIMHYMRAYGLDQVDKTTGDIKEDKKKDCFWKSVMEAKQQKGLRELFKNPSIDDEIQTIADDLATGRCHVTLKEQLAFKDAHQKYIEATQQFRIDRSNYEICLARLRGLLLSCAPYWLSDKTNDSISQGLTVAIQQNGKWVGSKLTQKTEALNIVRPAKKVVRSNLAPLGVIRPVQDEDRDFYSFFSVPEAAASGFIV